MAPTLRKGVVRGPQRQSYPSARKFCRCNQCSTNWEVEPGSNRMLVGRYLGLVEWDRHRAQELREGIVSAHVSLIPVDLTPPTLSLPTVPNLFSISSQTPTTPHTVNSTTTSSIATPLDETPLIPNPRIRKAKSQTKRIDFFTPKFRQIQSSLSSPPAAEIRAQIKRNPLVFVNSPALVTPLGPPSGISLYALEPDAVQNSTIIGREEWLEESQRFVTNNVRNIPKDKISLRLLATTLSKQIEKELTSLRREKRLEWARQRDAGIRAGNDGIDTSAWIRSCIF
jgi:hypothetical protein